jgi:outer membrane receptor protein involved in Fe transport
LSAALVAMQAALGMAVAFEGRVLLSDGTPVADASVSVVGRPGAVRTDRDGRFVWQPDPPVPFELFVLLPGGQAMVPARIDSIEVGGLVEVRVTPLLTETTRVVTEAAPHIQAPPANAVTRVDQQAIEARHDPNVTAVVADLPGGGTLEEGQSAVPSLRGMARGRTLILIDGARVTAERRAGPSATFLDPFVLEDLQVARGPGSVAYGSDAFGGVIHARTRQVDAGAEPTLRFRATAGAGIPEVGGALEFSRGFGEGGILAAGRARDFGDFDSPGGEVPDSAASDSGFLVRFNQEAGPGRLAIGWESDFGRDIGKPSALSNSVRAFYHEENSHRMTFVYDLDPLTGPTGLSIEGSWSRYGLITERQTLPTATTGLLVGRSDIEADDHGLRGIARRPAGRGRVEFGIDLNGRADLSADDARIEYDTGGALVTSTVTPSIVDADRFDAGLFAGGEWPVGGALNVAVGLRGDRVSTDNQGGLAGDHSTDEGDWSGYAALTVGGAHGWSGTIQAARGFHDPTLSDRYFVGTSGRGFVTGNPDLEPETSLQFDLAARYAGDRARLAFYAYQYEIENLIERYEGPDDMDPATPPQFYFRNRGMGRLRGLEFEARGTLPGGLTIEFVAQAARGEALDDDAPLADVPPEGAILTLRQAIAGKGDLWFRAAGYLRDEDPGPTETTTPGCAVFDLGGGWRFNDHVEARLVLRNILDHAYPGSPDSQAAPAPGRSAALTALFTF